MNPTMRAAVQRVYGDTDRLRLTEVDRPTPAHHEVLVAVRAAGLSPGDRAMLTGIPYINRLAASGLRRPKHPVPGFDCAGVVTEVGGDVTSVEIGDRVFGNAPGSFAEFAIAAEDQLAPIPSGWSFVDAAAVPESGCVALQAVRDHAEITADQQVAVVGAGGGVGCYVVQLAAGLGAHVTAVCGTRMVDAVRSLGAERVLDYSVDELTGVRQFDVIIDAAGRGSLRSLRRALTPHGRLVIVGADHRHRFTGGLGRWLRALCWSPFVSQRLRPFAARPLGRADLAALVRLMEEGTLRPSVDRTFLLDDAAAAMAHLDHRQSPGKVVVTVGDGGAVRDPAQSPNG